VQLLRITATANALANMKSTVRRVLHALTLQQAELLGGLKEELPELTAVSAAQGQAWTPGSLMSKSPQVGLDSGTQQTCRTRKTVDEWQQMAKCPCQRHSYACS
jgi:hypothetical protein